MISDAVTLAILTTFGFMMVYKKLPRKIRKFLEKHATLTDVIALLLTYTFLGGTLTALTAGALVGIFTSCLLYVANNPDDFLYLYDLRNFMKQKLGQMKETLNNYGTEYRERKVRSGEVFETQSLN